MGIVDTVKGFLGIGGKPDVTPDPERPNVGQNDAKVHTDEWVRAEQIREDKKREQGSKNLSPHKLPDPPRPYHDPTIEPKQVGGGTDHVPLPPPIDPTLVDSVPTTPAEAPQPGAETFVLRRPSGRSR